MEVEKQIPCAQSSKHKPKSSLHIEISIPCGKTKPAFSKQ
jgi:hypothetical protein